MAEILRLVFGYVKYNIPEGFDKIATAFQAEYQNAEEAFQSYASATRDAAKQCISDVIGQFLKERIIGLALSDALK